MKKSNTAWFGSFSPEATKPGSREKRSTFAKALSVCLFVISFFGISTANAQVGGATVKANFGVDGDLYANHHRAHGLIGAAGTDDWFRNTSLYPGSGLGVIDTTGAMSFREALIAAGSDEHEINQTFIRRMSAPKNSINGGNLWIDAIYVRDHISVQGTVDSTTFAAGPSDKNADNPETWDLNVGNVPPKDDLVDGYAHLRRDGATLSDDLWLFVGATTLTTNGNAHVDFEFFKNEVTMDLSDMSLGNLGPDGGHTQWTFGSTGAIQQTGDLILSLDFTNGGATPNASVRIWVDPNSLPGGSLAAYNGLEAAAFKFTGEFNSGNDASPYGYAEIIPLSGESFDHIFAKVNTEGPTLAAPWGHIEGAQGEFVNEIQKRGLVEGAINLTALGLESLTNTGCADLFGSIMIKTRSSQSFTAELKDFIGPHAFGSVDEVTFDLTKTDITCVANGTTSAINVSGTVSYQWSGAGLVSGGTSATAVWNEPGEKTLVVTLAGTTCQVQKSIVLGVGEGAISCNIQLDVYHGPEVLCNQTGRQVFTQVDAVSYEWSMILSDEIAGWEIVAGQGSKRITFNTGECGPEGFSAIIQLIVTSADGCKDTCTYSILGSNRLSTQRAGAKAYPSPFVDEVNFEFVASATGNARVEMYSATGTKVATVYDGTVEAGSTYKFNVNTSKLSGGVYFYKIVEADNLATVRKIILAR